MTLSWTYSIPKSTDQLEADIVKLEQEANDRDREIKSLNDKLAREQQRNDEFDLERDDLLQKIDTLQQELEAVKRANLNDDRTKEQIKVWYK